MGHEFLHSPNIMHNKMFNLDNKNYITEIISITHQYFNEKKC